MSSTRSDRPTPPLQLSPDRGLLFRITHIDNVAWLLANGLHAASGTAADPDFVAIGNPDLISDRARRLVPVPPGGTLGDYVPFYFTPKSPMLFNLKTGYGEVKQRRNTEIVVLVSSCQAMADNGVHVLFTDRHAYAATVNWSADRDAPAQMIDWDILNRHDFARSDSYPSKKERYQAEALAHRFVPTAALLGIGCAVPAVEDVIAAHVAASGLSPRVVIRPNWYF